jgi:hypothetical protein
MSSATGRVAALTYNPHNPRFASRASRWVPYLMPNADGLSGFLALPLLREVSDLALHLGIRVNHLGSLRNRDGAHIDGIHEFWFRVVDNLLGLAVSSLTTETGLFCGNVPSSLAVLNFG